MCAHAHVCYVRVCVCVCDVCYVRVCVRVRVCDVCVCICGVTWLCAFKRLRSDPQKHDQTVEKSFVAANC